MVSILFIILSDTLSSSFSGNDEYGGGDDDNDLDDVSFAFLFLVYSCIILFTFSFSFLHLHVQPYLSLSYLMIIFYVLKKLNVLS